MPITVKYLQLYLCTYFSVTRELRKAHAAPRVVKTHSCKCGNNYKSAAALSQHCSVAHGMGETLMLPPGSQIITLTTSTNGIGFKTPSTTLPTTLKNKVNMMGSKVPELIRKSFVNGRTLLQSSVLASGGFTVRLPSGSVEIALPVENMLSLPPLPRETTQPSFGNAQELLSVTSELEDLAAVVSTS